MEIKEFLRPTIAKVLLDVILSLILATVLLAIIPVISNVFMSADFFRKIIDVCVNGIMLAVIFYPWSCVVIELVNKKRKIKKIS